MSAASRTQNTVGFLLRDRMVQATLFAWFLFALPFYVPILPEGLLTKLSVYYSDFVMIILVIVAFAGRIRRSGSETARRFHQYITLGFGFWLLVSVFAIALPELQYKTLVSVFVDCLFLLLYLCLALASSTRPDLRRVAQQRTVEDDFDISGTVLFIFGLLVYLVLIPGTANQPEYDTSRPSLYLYIALDAYLAVRFGYLASTASARKWRVVYRLLMLATGGWMVLDTLELLSYEVKGFFVPSVSPSAWDPLWYAPFLIFVCAARVQRREFPEPVVASYEGEPEPFGLRRVVGPLVIYTFVFPSMHLFLHAFGLVDPATRFQRDVLVLFYLLSLGSLAVAKQRYVESQTMTLQRQRRKAEEALRLLEKAFHTMPLGLTITDLDGRILFTNPAEGDMHGYSVQELIGRPASMLAPEEFRRGHRRDHLERSGTWRRESMNQRRNGSRFPVQLISHMVRSTDGVPVALVTSCEDITERKQAELRLRESEERYRQLVESFPHAIFVAQRGQVAFANSAALGLMGIESVADIERAQVVELLAPPQELEMSGGITVHNDAQGILPRQLRLTRRDGSTVDLEVTRLETTYQGHRALQIVAHDVTETNRLRLRARRMEHLAALGQMSATLAHEIRNPLGAMALNLRYLSGQLPDSADARETLQDLFAGLDRLQTLVQGILNFTRPMVSSLGREDLSEVLQACLASAGRVCQGTGVKVVTNLHHPPTEVLVDVNQLTQVFTNLFENALQAMPHGGEIAVTTSRREDEVQIVVADTGIGIPPESLEKVFQPFFTTRVTGIGLGLAIVFRIVEQHGGDVAVESEVGRGTSFRITLPVADAASHDGEPLNRRSEIELVPSGPLPSPFS